MGQEFLNVLVGTQSTIRYNIGMSEGYSFF